MKLYHITTWKKERQNELIPRIPEETLWYEDQSTPRISLSSEIKGCVMGMGNQLENGINKIRVYSFEINKDDENLISWKKLYESRLVLDTPLTHEYWYTKKLIVTNYKELRIRVVEKEDFILIANYEKKKIIKLIEEEGICIPKEFKRKTAIEIINHYKNFINIDAVKNQLYHKEKKEESTLVDRELYEKIFGIKYNYEDDYEEVCDYSEGKYVVKYEII